MTYFATLVQCGERLRDFVRIHQRVRAVDQQQIDRIRRQIAQRLLSAMNDMVTIGNVVTKRMLWLGGGGNTALGDNLHALAQMRRQLQRFAKRCFALIASIDIRVIDGRHAEIQVLLNKTHQLARGHVPVHQTPVAHHET